MALLLLLPNKYVEDWHHTLLKAQADFTPYTLPHSLILASGEDLSNLVVDQGPMSVENLRHDEVRFGISIWPWFFPFCLPFLVNLSYTSTGQVVAGYPVSSIMSADVLSFLTGCDVNTKYKLSIDVKSISSRNFSVGEYKSGEASKIRAGAVTWLFKFAGGFEGCYFLPLESSISVTSVFMFWTLLVQ